MHRSSRYSKEKDLLEIVSSRFKELDLLQVLMDNIPDTIYFKDEKSRFILINKAQCEILGVKNSKEAYGKTDFDFFTPEHAKDAWEDEQRIVATGIPVVGKIERIRRADGKFRWVTCTKVPIRDKNGIIIGIAGISRDITELREAEESLRRSEEALREANKSLEQKCIELAKLKEEVEEANRTLQQSNADLENYTYIVSHDLRAPLRAIKAFSTFLAEDYKDKLDENAQEYIRRIVNAVSNMDAMIEDLLLLSRVGRKYTNVEEVNMNQLIDEIIIDLEPIIKKRNGVVKYDNLPKIRTQRVWIKQFFMNLIDNGLKFNQSEKPTVEISCEEKENEYLFKVKDNGIGIDKKYFDRLFKIFERLHKEDEYEGTGAGLAICKKIADHFGGKVWVESEVGKGSTFYLLLPKNLNVDNTNLN
ncbi:PAS domain S-box protein [Candidatus Bathyarchaeota archaeon]|nr:PAS domain S-box protein [Candidatus Bathyarchaeota archaeon]